MVISMFDCLPISQGRRLGVMSKSLFAASQETARQLPAEPERA